MGPRSLSVSITSKGSIRAVSPVARHLDHDVELGHAVVDDAEAHAAVVQPGRDVEIGGRG